MIRVKGNLFLIDSGEGTQISIKKLGWGFKDINAILITHLHADHVTGLPGLLLTMGNAGKTNWLILYGPKEIERIVDGIKAFAPNIPFPIEWVEIGGGEKIEIGGIKIETLNVDHGVPCLAYSIKVSRGRRFDPEKAAELRIPLQLWKRLQNGETVEWEGKKASPAEVLGRKRRGIKVTYVTDTRPTDELAEFVRGSDLLICEGMYGSEEDIPKAIEKKHMIFAEAANIAKLGNAKELWLTHYSPSMAQPEKYLDEATKVFPNTKAGHDLMTKTIAFKEEGEEQQAT